MADPMERCRKRLALLLDVRTHSGVIRQKRFAEYMDKSEAWVTNVLQGKRGIRIVDLDKVADFFRIPPSDLVREDNAELIEVTPSEKALLRKMRRMGPDAISAFYTFAGLMPPPSPTPTKKVKPKPKPKRPKRHDETDTNSDGP